MKPRASRDLQALAVVPAAVLVLAVALRGSRAFDALVRLPGQLVAHPVVLLGASVVVASLVALGIRRARRVRQALAGRRRWLVLPADTFDPSVEAVVRFASQLARVRRRGLARSSAAVRVRLDSAGDGRVVYSLEAPDGAREVIYAAIDEYPGVELRDAEPTQPGGADA